MQRKEMDEKIEILERAIDQITGQVKDDCDDIINVNKKKSEVEVLINIVRNDLSFHVIQNDENRNTFRDFENHFQNYLDKIQNTKEEMLQVVEKHPEKFEAENIEQMAKALDNVNENVDILKQIYELVLGKITGLDKLEKRAKEEIEKFFESLSDLEAEVSLINQAKRTKEELLQNASTHVNYLKSDRASLGKDVDDELKQKIVKTLQELYTEMENTSIQRLSMKTAMGILEGPLKPTTIKVVASSLKDLEAMRDLVNESLERLHARQQTIDDQLQSLRNKFLSTPKKKSRAKSIAPKKNSKKKSSAEGNESD